MSRSETLLQTYTDHYLLLLPSPHDSFPCEHQMKSLPTLLHDGKMR